MNEKLLLKVTPMKLEKELKNDQYHMMIIQRLKSVYKEKFWDLRSQSKNRQRFYLRLIPIILLDLRNILPLLLYASVVSIIDAYNINFNYNYVIALF